jgi:hypothetical protein
VRRSSATPIVTVKPAMPFEQFEAVRSFRSGSRHSLRGAVAISLVWLFMAAPAHAQTVIDGSDQGLLRGELPLLISVLERGLTRSDGRGAATTARVRGIVQAEAGVYCGEVSTRDRDGQYGPFTRFVVETKIRQATIAPVNEPARDAMLRRMIDARCASAGGTSR